MAVNVRSFDTPDETTYVFTLAPDVTFSDGTPLTAGDVKFTLDGYRDPELGARTWASVIDSVDVIDDRTLAEARA